MLVYNEDSAQQWEQRQDQEQFMTNEEINISIENIAERLSNLERYL